LIALSLPMLFQSSFQLLCSIFSSLASTIAVVTNDLWFVRLFQLFVLFTSNNLEDAPPLYFWIFLMGASLWIGSLPSPPPAAPQEPSFVPRATFCSVHGS
jgi:hypothetical protein